MTNPADEPEHPRSSWTERARSAISSFEDNDRVRQAAAATRDAAARTQEASKNLTRKVTQEESWEALREDIEELTEIARAHHALILDLLDRLDALEALAGTGGR